MMPASAASIGPRNEVSSQGYTTTVVAAGTSLARAISRSYLVCGGAANGPSAEIVSDVVLVARHDRVSASVA